MNKEIKIGPIRRRRTIRVNAEIIKQVSKMKIGEFFEVTGIESNTASRLRAILSYYSKKEGFRVATSLSGETLTIERIRK